MTDKIEKLPNEKIPSIWDKKEKPTKVNLDNVEYKKPEEETAKLSIFQKIWLWIDGKKTLIGASGSLIGLGLTKIAHPIAQLVGYILQGICYPLTATGIIHKVDKAIKSDKHGKPGELKLGDKDLVSLAIMAWSNLKELFSIITEIFKRIKKKKGV